MPTERLYYDDPFLLSFTARVVERRVFEGRPALLLDRTAFYPASGGQPHDRGTLNGIPVWEVREEEGEILHILGEDPAGDVVQGQVEWERRFDHMQQHTGQHILSQALERRGAATSSFHIGEEVSTIDLDRASFSPEELAQAEDEANAIVFEDRPVRTYFVTPEELAGLPLRKSPAGYERVRIVEVERYDWSPCGGTHCTRTGQVGPIRIVHSERRGAETRVTFLCGWRALRDARWKHHLLTQLGLALTVGIPHLPAAVAKLSAEAEEARKAMEEMRRVLLRYEARERYAQAEAVGPARVVRAVFPGRPLEEVRLLAREIAALPGGVALLGIAGDEGRLCFARAEGLPWDMGVLVREAAAILGGRGGGRPHDAQGGGPEVGRLEEALERAMARLRAWEGERHDL
ncbi:MAG: alanyl-tRNA editing protein [Chloroflexia bacterium]